MSASSSRIPASAIASMRVRKDNTSGSATTSPSYSRSVILCAAAIVAHRITEREYDGDVVADPDVLSLRTRIDAIADAGIREDEADIVVELQDGRSLHHHVEHAIGSAQRPMSDGDI